MILILIRFFLSEIFNAKILYGYINMIIFSKCLVTFLSVQLIYYILRSSKFMKKITIYPLYMFNSNVVISNLFCNVIL